VTDNQQKRLDELEHYIRTERDKLDFNDRKGRDPLTNALAWIILIRKDQ